MSTQKIQNTSAGEQRILESMTLAHYRGHGYKALLHSSYISGH